jgi:D-beta-D-heptose 7-phosphate kinase/D-beta-D-heptose 1-phosphate adenosyltransferase
MSSGTPDPGIVASLARARVVCCGDVMLDRFVSGTVERISPEAPVPVLRIAGHDAMPGGAGNVVRNLAALGASAHLAAVVGVDAEGEELRALLGRLPRVTSRLLVDAGRPTTLKTRFLAGGQQILRTDDESTAELPPSVRDALFEAVEGALGDCDALVLSDYVKGTLAGGLAARLIAAARARALPVLVDPKGADYAPYAGCDVITPNRRELALAVGGLVAPGEEAAAARALIARLRCGAVVVTLGADGMLVVPADGDAVRLPARARAVFDVSGAGDTAVAALAAALASGIDLGLAAAIANAAAGIVVGKVGTAVAGADELARALRHEALAGGEGKVVSVEALGERLAGWRRRGLRVGFTNGCFDLVHPGHVAVLNEAKAACDRLIVGLNSDASVARLKGPGRPVQGEAARALVLASFAAVDAVVVFGEDTPLALIEAIRPDVLIKGADYRREDVVGADLVEGYGGRVLLAAIAPGYSTSGTIARLCS